MPADMPPTVVAIFVDEESRRGAESTAHPTGVHGLRMTTGVILGVERAEDFDRTGHHAKTLGAFAAPHHDSTSMNGTSSTR